MYNYLTYSKTSVMPTANTFVQKQRKHLYIKPHDVALVNTNGKVVQ